MATTRREFLKNVSLASVGMAIGGVDMIASAADKPAAAGASSPKGGKVKIAYIRTQNGSRISVRCLTKPAILLTL